MGKILLTVLVIVLFVGNCFADEKSEQIKTTFKAIEKVHSKTGSAIDNPKNFIEAVDEAEAESNFLYNRDKSECSRLLLESTFIYRTAAICLEAENPDKFINSAQKALKVLTKAYEVCYPKGKNKEAGNNQPQSNKKK